MPLSWNEIRDRSVAFVREWENESSEHAEAKRGHSVESTPDNAKGEQIGCNCAALARGSFKHRVSFQPLLISQSLLKYRSLF